MKQQLFKAQQVCHPATNTLCNSKYLIQSKYFIQVSTKLYCTMHKRSTFCKLCRLDIEGRLFGLKVEIIFVISKNRPPRDQQLELKEFLKLKRMLYSLNFVLTSHSNRSRFVHLLYLIYPKQMRYQLQAITLSRILRIHITQADTGLMNNLSINILLEIISKKQLMLYKQ